MYNVHYTKYTSDMYLRFEYFAYKFEYNQMKTTLSKLKERLSKMLQISIDSVYKAKYKNPKNWIFKPKSNPIQSVYCTEYRGRKHGNCLFVWN